MADLNSNRSSSPLFESDDISILVHTLLQSSTLPSSVSLDASQHSDHQQRPPEPEIRRQFCGSAAFSDSSSGMNFPSRGDYYAPDESERSRCAFSGAILSSAEGIDELDCESEDKDASYFPRRSGPLRSSSKRTRAAEIHNLSEKRRRQRINEKMKALQKLIPNSNKTDRASMLEDAIEYLKQLQLQVQMLALRNRSALHPCYTPGVMHSAQPSDPGICFNGVDGLPSSSRRTSSRSTDRKISRQTVFNPASSICASSDQKNLMPVALETGNSECPFAMEASTSTHC